MQRNERKKEEPGVHLTGVLRIAAKAVEKAGGVPQALERYNAVLIKYGAHFEPVGGSAPDAGRQPRRLPRTLD